MLGTKEHWGSRAGGRWWSPLLGGVLAICGLNCSGQEEPRDAQVVEASLEAEASSPMRPRWHNPPVQRYVEQHAELGDGFEIEIYGELKKETIQAVDALGVPFKHFVTTDVGYVRESITG